MMITSGRRLFWGLVLSAMTAVCLWGCAYQVVQPINESIFGKEHFLIAEGRYAELEQYLEDKLQNQASPKPMDLYLLCMAHGKVKRYDKFFSCLGRMEKLPPSPMYGGIRKPGERSLFGNALRAEVLLDFGDYRQAVAEAKQALRLSQIVREKMGRTAEAGWIELTPLAVMGLGQALLGEKEEAMRAAQTLEQMRLPAYSKSLPVQRAMAVAKIYMAMGEYEKALEIIRQSEASGAWKNLEYLGNFLAGMGWGVGSSRFNNSYELPQYFMKCKLLLETGNLKEAKEGFDLLLKIPVIETNGGLYWVILFDRGRIAEKEGDRKGAVSYYRRAIEVIEAQRSTINTEVGKIGFVGDKQNVYRRLIALLYDAQEFSSAFEYVERSKSRALVDLLAAQRDFAAPAGNEHLAQQLLELKEKAEMDALAQDDMAEPAHTRSVLIKAKDDLREKAPELASLVTVTSLSFGEIKRHIPDDETLLEYYYDEGNLYAFVISEGKITAQRLRLDGLQEDVREFRRSLENPGANNYGILSRRLFQRLIKPLGTLARRTKLIIVPQGVLHYLPFNALHDGRGYFLEQSRIRMIPSASALKYLRPPLPQRPADILIFGNPDLGDSRLDLVYAQKEALTVARMRPQAKVLLRGEATETAFRKYGATFHSFHFATHGQFDPEHPLKSALRLAGDGQSNGVLSVEKLYSLKLDADLVTLSACETGLGKVATGDDVVGLTRGFLYAGSRSIVASLWKVDDLSTAALMETFYSLLNQADKGEALRQAQIETMKKYPHPYYWASFQLTGHVR